MNLSLLIIPIIIFCSIYFLCKKFNLLIDNTSFSDHKKIGISNQSPIILGGVYLTISILFLISNDYNILKLICICILFLGLLSDRNYLSNPSIRLLIQVLILLVLIYFEKLTVNYINIEFIDIILKIEFFNVILSLFCFAVLLNGSNFLDGLNGLLSGYYLIVLCSLIYIGSTSSDIQINQFEMLNFIFLLLLIFFIFNVLGLVYLGDSGSYILSIIVGFILIKVHQNNIYISPYYILAVLWYPAFENLFSLIRRLIVGTKVSSADKLHLHQLTFRYLRLKKIFSEKTTNTFSSLLILLINLPLFIIATMNYSHTKTLLSATIFNIFVYLIFYFYLIRYFELKK